MSGGADAFAQSSRDFSFAEAAVIDWGTGLLENYDVAVRLAGNGLAGKEVTGFRLPLAGEGDISDITMWMSSSLILEGKINQPDIFSVPVVLKEGFAEVKLPEAYEIPADGVYIGCSFHISTLTPATKTPLSVSEGGNKDTFLIHTSRKYSKWGSYNLDLALDLTVTLKGNFNQSSIEVVKCDEGNILSGNIWTPEIRVRNLGMTDCRSLGYTLVIDGESSEVGEVTLSTPLNPSFSTEHHIALNPLPAPESGTHTWSVIVDEVNGEHNQEILNKGDGELYVWPYLPEHRPLMEEYTGTWCGWCPRGAVGLSKMQEKYGSDFVGVVYHTDPRNDAMATSVEPTTKYEGAPWGVLDRTIDADPFFGFSHDCALFSDGIEVAWIKSRNEPTPVDLRGEAFWNDYGHRKVTVKSEVTFVRDYKHADIRFAYFLIADGLKGNGPGWIQSNYYSGMTQYADGDLRCLYEQPRYMVDYEFDHVLVYTPDAFGLKDSLPSDISWLTAYDDIAELPLEMAVNAAGETLVQDKSKLHVVIAVVDAVSNKILNSCLLEISDQSGIASVGSKANVVERRYFDLQGRPLCHEYSSGIGEQGSRFAGGHVIIVEVNSDGSVSSHLLSTGVDRR